MIWSASRRRGEAGEVRDRVLRAVGGGEVCAAGEIVVGDVDLVAREGFHEVGHALARVGDVLAVREAGDEILEALEGIARGLGIAVRQVLAHEPRQRTQVFLEVRQGLEIQRVVDVRMVRVRLDELVERAHRLRRLRLLVVRIRLLELGLVGEAPERELRLELVVELDRRVPVARLELVVGGLVVLGGLPVLLGIGHLAEQAAAAQGSGEEQGGQCRYTSSHGQFRIAKRRL